MNIQRKRLVKLVGILEKKIEKAEEIAKRTKESADESAKSAIDSWSAAGDREHTRGQAEIAAENLRKIKELKNEIESFLDKPAPEKVEPVSFVTVKFDDSTLSEFYLVKSPIYIDGIIFVTSESRFGKAIMGKKPGEKLDFGKGGRIISIE